MQLLPLCHSLLHAGRPALLEKASVSTETIIALERQNSLGEGADDKKTEEKEEEAEANKKEEDGKKVCA